MGKILAFAYGLVSYAVFFASVLYASGFVGDLVVPKTIDSGTVGPLVRSLAINALVLLFWQWRPLQSVIWAVSDPIAVTAIWATPSMSLGHLAFAIATTAFVLVAIQLEEHDMLTLFGDTYRRYQRQVSMIVPWIPSSKA